jgi:thioredoxin-related protein
LPTAKDLSLELSQALMKHEPLIVMVSLDGCPFCKIARDNYLRSVQLEQHLKILQLDMGRSSMVIDFQGRPTTHEQLIQSWGIKLAPTLLFFGKDGKELVERLVGGSSSDFYGSYLDERIARALQLSKL